LAINRLHQLPDANVSNSLIANLFNPDVLLLQSAANSIYQMDPEAYQTHTNRLKSYSKLRLDKIILPPIFLYKDEDNYQKMLLVERVRFMKSISSFAAIPGDSITRMVDSMNERKVAKGTALINEGDDGDQPLFIMINGKVDLIRAGAVFKSLGPKDILGEEAILFIVKFVFQEITTEETSFFILPKEELFDLMTLHVEILRAFLEHIDTTVKTSPLDPFDLSILDDNVSVFN
jgi:AAA family ATP:ADP antiporter